MYKPQVPYTPQIYKNFQTVFGGYNHTSSCGEGEIYDMKNIGHEEFPVLTPRRGRNTAPAFDNGRIFPAYSETEIVRPKIRGIYSFDDAYVIEQPYIMNPNLTELTGNLVLRVQRENIKAFEVQNVSNKYNIADATNLDGEAFVVINKYLASRLGRIARRDVKYYIPYSAEAVDAAIYLKELVTTGVIQLKANDVIAYGSYMSTAEDGARYQAMRYTYYYWDGEAFQILGTSNAVVNKAYVGEFTFSDGLYKEEEAEANTIKSEPDDNGGSVQFQFMPGDGVKITGCTKQPKNNKSAVIKEVPFSGVVVGGQESSDTLCFYENTFTLVNDAPVTEENVTISRLMPELDFMCHCNNRLFGCKGDTIYASKLGDPYNWNVFEGISTDSYSVDVGSPGDFTGCCAYGGDVLFFKEERIYKLMYTDNSPENWSLVEIETYGVKAGCENSLAIADSCLFYYSPKGMMRYTGSLPMSINEAFGEQEFVNAVAGSDGKDYYVCLTDKAGESALFVYDTTHFLWFKHDDVKITSFAYHKGDLTALVEKENGDTEVMRIGQKIAEVPIEGEWVDLESMIEFGDVMNDTTNKKLKLNISVTAEVAPKSELRFYVSCDGGSYEFLGKIEGKSNKQTHKFSFVPTRCDYYRLKVEGKGLWKIYAISNGYTPGSDI